MKRRECLRFLAAGGAAAFLENEISQSPPVETQQNTIWRVSPLSPSLQERLPPLNLVVEIGPYGWEHWLEVLAGLGGAGAAHLLAGPSFNRPVGRREFLKGGFSASVGAALAAVTPPILRMGLDYALPGPYKDGGLLATSNPPLALARLLVSGLIKECRQPKLTLAETHQLENGATLAQFALEDSFPLKPARFFPQPQISVFLAPLGCQPELILPSQLGNNHKEIVLAAHPEEFGHHLLSEKVMAIIPAAGLDRRLLGFAKKVVAKTNGEDFDDIKDILPVVYGWWNTLSPVSAERLSSRAQGYLEEHNQYVDHSSILQEYRQGEPALIPRSPFGPVWYGSQYVFDGEKNEVIGSQHFSHPFDNTLNLVAVDKEGGWALVSGRWWFLVSPLKVPTILDQIGSLLGTSFVRGFCVDTGTSAGFYYRPPEKINSAFVAPTLLITSPIPAPQW